MKRLITAIAILLAIGSAKGQTNSYSYDWMNHQKRIDAVFQKHIPEILKSEKEKIESILPKDKANQYMKHFEEGLNSETGIIMIEGAESRWLEIAYREGYARKNLFRQGYFSGLSQEAEEKN
jgi:hypothetical protein